jgi:hypothetical protein
MTATKEDLTNESPFIHVNFTTSFCKLFVNLVIEASTKISHSPVPSWLDVASNLVNYFGPIAAISAVGAKKYPRLAEVQLQACCIVSEDLTRLVVALTETMTRILPVADTMMSGSLNASQLPALAKAMDTMPHFCEAYFSLLSQVGPSLLCRLQQFFW